MSTYTNTLIIFSILIYFAANFGIATKTEKAQDIQTFTGEKKNEFSVLFLYDQIYFKIFDYLSKYEWTCVVPRVCEEWRNAIEKKMANTYSKLDELKITDELVESFFDREIRAVLNERKRTFKNPAKPTDEKPLKQIEWKFGISVTSSISDIISKILTFINTGIITKLKIQFEAISTVAPGDLLSKVEHLYPTLQVFSIKNYILKNTDMNKICQKSLNLKEIEILGRTQADIGTISCLSGTKIKLERLIFPKLSQPSSFKFLSTIKDLKVRHIRLIPRFLPKLEILDQCSPLTSENQKLLSIKSRYIRKIKFIYHDGLNLKDFPLLTSVTIFNIPASEVQELINQCPNLEEVRIYVSSSYELNHFNFESMKNLKVVVIASRRNMFSPLSYHSLVNSPKLQVAKFPIGDFGTIGYGVLEKLIKFVPNLQHMVLTSGKEEKEMFIRAARERKPSILLTMYYEPSYAIAKIVFDKETNPYCDFRWKDFVPMK